MRDRQLCAVTLAAASVPALLYLPRLGWVWATAAAAISALLLGLCGRRCAPGGLTEVIPAAFGRAGRAVLALVLLGGALLLGGAARALCAIYPESRGGPLTGLLLLLAAAYAAERGEETVLRSGAILFFFLTAVEAVILGFSAVQVRAAWLAPQTGRVPFAAMTAALSPMAVLYVRGGARRTGGWLAAGIGLCAAAALCAAGTLSPRVAGKFLDSYYDHKIYESDPFAHLDQKGVGKLVKMAAEMGRATRPHIKLGICGEHGGDPASVEFCHNVGLNYVSPARGRA